MRCCDKNLKSTFIFERREMEALCFSFLKAPVQVQRSEIIWWNRYLWVRIGMNNVVSYSNGQEVNFSIQTHQTLMIKRGNYCFDTIYSSKDCMIFEILEKTVQTTKHIGNSTVSSFDVVFTNPTIRRFSRCTRKIDLHRCSKSNQCETYSCRSICRGFSSIHSLKKLRVAEDFSFFKCAYFSVAFQFKK